MQNIIQTINPGESARIKDSTQPSSDTLAQGKDFDYIYCKFCDHRIRKFYLFNNESNIPQDATELMLDHVYSNHADIPIVRQLMKVNYEQ